MDSETTRPNLEQSLSVLNLDTDELTDFPDDRLGRYARQTYFLGLAFSLDGKHLYASIASYTDPLGKKEGSTGNGIAVYSFDDGKITPEQFPENFSAHFPSARQRAPLSNLLTSPTRPD